MSKFYTNKISLKISNAFWGNECYKVTLFCARKFE